MQNETSLTKHSPFKDITDGGLYLYSLGTPIIMHSVMKYHKEHENLTIRVPELLGLLMDKWYIQILIDNTQVTFLLQLIKH